jgi:dsDNA-specific endonuclease/ATPase MutS2
VRKLRAGAQVIAVDLKEQSASLAIGSIRLSEKLSGLRRIKPRPERRAGPEASANAESASAVYLAPSSSNTLDLRGKRAEEALWESEERYRALFDHWSRLQFAIKYFEF